MPTSTPPRDRFDDVPRDPARVGAHRAPAPRLRWLVILLWWVLAVVVLTGGGIFAFLALSNTQAIDLPEPPPTAGQTEEVEAVIDTDYFVLVVNGTPDTEVADAVREAVVGAGWSDDMVADLPADVTDFDTTTVFYVDAEDAGAARGLADELGIDATAQSADFDEQSEGGLTVVIGLDRLSGD